MTESISSSYSNVIQNQERPYPFLSNDTLSAERKSAFLTEDMLSSDRPSPFLTKENFENTKSPFLTADMLPEDRPSSFLENNVDTTEAKNPLAHPEIEKKEEEEKAETENTRLPMNEASIISELQRNPMSSTLTIRDIAEDFNIPYIKAMYIYKTINEDANGIVREFNLPDRNATVSYLV